MTRILIGIDGSQGSLGALDYAIARKRRGEEFEALLIHVQPLIRAHGPVITKAMVRDYQAQEAEKVLSAAGLKSRAKYLNADAYVENGDAAECIIAFAKKSKCSEIIMGSRGLGPLTGLVLGSVVAKVIQLAKVPVVVVKS